MEKVYCKNAIQSLVDLKELQHQSVSSNSTVPFANSNEQEEKGFKHILEQCLPNRSKNNGIALYNILKDQISWDDSGQIIIDGEAVVGSSIVDLISDLTREWKKPPITGWHKIKQELQAINFPKSLIQNKQRLFDLGKHSTYPQARNISSRYLLCLS